LLGAGLRRATPKSQTMTTYKSHNRLLNQKSIITACAKKQSVNKKSTGRDLQYANGILNTNSSRQKLIKAKPEAQNFLPKDSLNASNKVSSLQTHSNA